MKTFNQIFGASLPTSEDDRKEFLANNCNHVAKGKDIIADCIGDILNRFPKLAMIYKQ